MAINTITLRMGQVVNSTPLIRLFLRYYPHWVTLEIGKGQISKGARYSTQSALLGQIGGNDVGALSS